MIVLHAAGEADLVATAAMLAAAGVSVAKFHEPDLDGQITAIAACGAQAKRALAPLKLAA
jgi:hypothetical protein